MEYMGSPLSDKMEWVVAYKMLRQLISDDDVSDLVKDILDSLTTAFDITCNDINQCSIPNDAAPTINDVQRFKNMVEWYGYLFNAISSDLSDVIFILANKERCK